MALFTGAEMAAIVGGTVLAGPAGLAGARVLRVHSDSRSVKKGDLFVALPGERFDAHAFVPAAVAAGAAAVIVRADYAPPPALLATGAPVYGVADPLRAFQQLAAA